MKICTYHVHGFFRSNHDNNVSILVDAEYCGDPANNHFAIARRLTGDDVCFHMSENVTVAVPEDAKNILFRSEEELFAKVPQLDPRWQRRQRAQVKRQQRQQQREREAQAYKRAHFGYDRDH